MKCKFCKKDMKSIYCTDNPDEGYAYNIYVCDYCDSICKEDVWDNKGQFWINNNTTETFFIKAVNS